MLYEFFDSRCKGYFIGEVVVCIRSSSVWAIFRWNYGKYERWQRVLEGKGLRINIEKTKGMQFLHRKKVYVSKVDPYGVTGE